MSHRPAPIVVGVVNVTPDSFSDGGDHGDGVAHALAGRPAPNARAGDGGRAHIELDEHQNPFVALRGDAQVEPSLVGRGEALGQASGAGRQREVAALLGWADGALERKRQPEGDGGRLNGPIRRGDVSAANVHREVENVLCVR